MPKFLIYPVGGNETDKHKPVTWNKFNSRLSVETIEMLLGYHKGKKFSELMDLNLACCMNGGLKIGNMKYVILKDEKSTKP